jgi:hypothetical protein
MYYRFQYFELQRNFMLVVTILGSILDLTTIVCPLFLYLFFLGFELRALCRHLTI